MARRRSVNCPQCDKLVEWTPANRFRPFCSERCKLIDLGAWATETYRVPVADSDADPQKPGQDKTPRR